MKAEKFNVVDFVIAVEAGECTKEEIISGFQNLIDSGICWQLQGWYGRTAQDLIEAGYCQPKRIEN